MLNSSSQITILSSVSSWSGMSSHHLHLQWIKQDERGVVDGHKSQLRTILTTHLTITSRPDPLLLPTHGNTFELFQQIILYQQNDPLPPHTQHIKFVIFPKRMIRIILGRIVDPRFSVLWDKRVILITFFLYAFRLTCGVTSIVSHIITPILLVLVFKYCAFFILLLFFFSLSVDRRENFN